MHNQSARIKVQRTTARDPRAEHQTEGKKCLFKSLLALFFPRGHARGTDLQTVFEAVGWRLVAAVGVLLPPLAEQQGPLVQEEVALHGLEASQLLHAGGPPLVADPHAEGALHQHSAQLANVALPVKKLKVNKVLQFPARPTSGHRRRLRTSYPVMAI